MSLVLRLVSHDKLQPPNTHTAQFGVLLEAVAPHLHPTSLHCTLYNILARLKLLLRRGSLRQEAAHIVEVDVVDALECLVHDPLHCLLIKAVDSKEGG